MPNLEFELRQLRLADVHIRSTERAVEKLRGTIVHLHERGDETELLSRSLTAATDMLQTLYEHRGLIVQTIDDVRAGRLPAT